MRGNLYPLKRMANLTKRYLFPTLILKLGTLLGLGGLWAGLFSALPGKQPAAAQTCTARCGSRQIQFTPGQRIRIQVVNRTPYAVQVEHIAGTEAVLLAPDAVLNGDPHFGTRPNASIVFWEDTALPVRAILFRPESNALQIELVPGRYGPGDRTVYINDDGRVVIF